MGTAGTLTINGNYTQTAAGTLAVDIGGGTPGTQYDQLNVSGAVALGGTINVNRPGNYVPPSLAVFQIVGFGSVSGDFATRNGFNAGGGQVFDEQFTSANLDLVTNFAQLSFQAEPSNTTAGQTFAAVQVAVLDSGGHVVTGDNSDMVTLTLNKGTLLGTLSEPVVNGVATFSDLSITKADTNYQLTAAVTAIPSVPSSLFNIGPANAAQLAYVVAPGNIVFGTAFNPVVEVATEDKYGNVETGDSSSQVTLSLSTNPTGAALTGATNPATVSNGIATFTGLTVSEGGIGYQMQAQVPSLPALPSSSFNVSSIGTTTAEARNLSVTYSSAAQTLGLSATVTAANSALTVNEGSVTWTLLNGSTPVGSPVSGNVTSGSASANYTLPAGTAGGSYTIQAVYNSTAEYATSSDSSHTLTVNAAGTTTAAVTTAAVFSAASQGVGLSATVTSPAGTVNGGSVTFTILNGSATVGSPTSGNVVSGTAIANYTLPAGLADGAYTIQASYGGSGSFTASSDSSQSLFVGTIVWVASGGGRLGHREQLVGEPRADDDRRRGDRPAGRGGDQERRQRQRAQRPQHGRAVVLVGFDDHHRRPVAVPGRADADLRHLQLQRRVDRRDRHAAQLGAGHRVGLDGGGEFRLAGVRHADRKRGGGPVAMGAGQQRRRQRRAVPASGVQNHGTILLQSISSTYSDGINVAGERFTNAADGTIQVGQGTGGGRYLVGNFTNLGAVSVAAGPYFAVNATGSRPPSSTRGR